MKNILCVILLTFSMGTSLNAQNFWTKVYTSSANSFTEFCETDNGYVFSLINQSSVMKSINSGASWTMPTQPGHPVSNANCLAASGNTLFLGNYSDISTMQGKGVFVSTDYGSTWTKKTSGMGADTNIVYIRVHKNGNVEAFHQYDDGWGSNLFKSYLTTDGGNSWTYSNNWGFGFYGLRCKFVFTPTATYFGNFKTSNDGVTWTNITSATVSPLAYSAISDSLFGVSDFYSDFALIFRSKDGITWDSYTISGFSPDCRLENLIIIANDTMYASSSSSTANQAGVFRSIDKGHTWSRVVTGLPVYNQVIWDMYLSKAGFLFIGLNTYGIYRSKKSTPQVITSTVGQINQIPFNIWQEQGNVYVKFTLEQSGIVNMNLYDLNGVLKKTYANETSFSSGDNEMLLPTSDLNYGVYLISIESNGRVSKGKIVVESK